MGPKSKKRASPAPPPAPRPYHRLLPFLASTAASLLYVAPQETGSLAMAAVKCSPLVSLTWLLLKTERLRGDVVWVLPALFCSYFGDSFLVWPEETFVHGVIIFWVMQVFFIISLGFRKVDWRFGIGAYGISLALFLSVFNYLPTADIRLATCFYSFTLATVLWRALDRFRLNKEIRKERRICSAVGAVIFCISDFSIGLLQFGKLVPHLQAQLFILSTYYVAQGLLILGACEDFWGHAATKRKY